MGTQQQAAPQAQLTHGCQSQLWVYRSQGSSTRDIGEIAPGRWGSTIERRVEKYPEEIAPRWWGSTL